MVDNIVELENNKKYVILDECELDNVKYYYGLKLNDNEEPTNVYLFFEEIIENEEVYLKSIEDDKIKGLLLTAFTINYAEKVYDEVLY